MRLAVILAICMLPMIVVSGEVTFPASRDGFPNYQEPGSLKYTIHELDIPGTAYRAVQMSRDRFGRLILASGGSVWTFDGSQWEESIKRDSIERPISGISVGGNGTVYIGSNGDWGTMELTPQGIFEFVSYKDSEDPEQSKILDDLYRVEVFEDGVSFMSNTACVYMPFQGKTVARSGFYRLTTQFELKGRRYVCSEREGLICLSESEGLPIDCSQVPSDTFFTASGEFDSGHAILGSNESGLFLFDGETVSPYVLKSDLLIGKRVNDVQVLEGRYVAVTMDDWGLAIFSKEGELQYFVSSEMDGRFLRAAEIHYFNNGNLWISIGNAVARFFFPSPVSVFDHRLGLFVSWPSPYRYMGKLWVRSNRTIYEGIYDENLNLNAFRKAGFPEGNLGVDAMMGTPEGLFYSDKSGLFLRDNDGRTTTISSTHTSFYLFLHPHRSDILFSYNMEGIYVFRKINGEWRYNGDFLSAPGTYNEVFIEDANGAFWTERGIGRIVKFGFDDDQLTGRVYSTEDGLDNTWISMYLFDGVCHISNGYKSHSRYDEKTDAFVPAPLFRQIEAELGLTFSRPFQLENGTLLLPTTGGMVVASKNPAGNWVYDFSTFAPYPEYNPTVIRCDGDEVWIRSQNSLMRYLSNSGPMTNVECRTVIEKVGVPGSDDVLYSASREGDNVDAVMHVNYHDEGIMFRFFTPRFDSTSLIRHRFMLEGFSSKWSEPSGTNEASFIGIREGHYTFVVESVDHFGQRGPPTRFEFVIHPPWYRSVFAYVSYGALLILFIVWVVHINRHKVVIKNRELEKLVNQRTHELKDAAQQAFEATKAKSQFLANMSHEIRTPINGIIGSSELMSSHTLTYEQKELMHIIESSATSLISLVDGILDFSRIEANRVELRKDNFNLNRAIEECTDVLAIISQRKRVELFYHIETDVPENYIGDVGRLKQVIINLIGNALKFTQQGHVRLDCRQLEKTEGRVRLGFVVEDTGIGIEETSISRLFEPFQQGDNSNTRMYGGAGLGLAICRQLVELMEGKIEVESKVGVGTRICFDVWMQLDAQAERLWEDISFYGFKVLNIDSDPVRRSQWKSFFEKRGVIWSDVGNAEGVLRNNDEEMVADAVILEYQDDKTSIHVADRFYTALIAGNIRVLSIFANSDLRIPDHLRPFVHHKPYTYNKMIHALLPDSTDFVDVAEPEVVGTVFDVPAKERSGKQPRILIVEDNQVNHRVIELLLSNLGYKADHAWNGLEAVEKCSRCEYDILLMDVQMPKLDGIEATKQIRKVHPDAIIIGLSANAQESDRMIAQAAGMDDFLTKPVRKNELIQSLERALGKGQSDHLDKVK